MAKNNNIGKVVAGLTAAAALGFMGGKYSNNSPIDVTPTPLISQEPYQEFNEAVIRSETERLSQPYAVENRLASQGVENIDNMLEIVSGMYAVNTNTEGLDDLTRILTENKQAWKGIGVYNFQGSPFGEGDLDIDTGIKEWYGGEDRRNLWIIDYDIGLDKNKPRLEELLKKRSTLRERIFGPEVKSLGQNDLQKMLEEGIRENSYNE